MKSLIKLIILIIWIPAFAGMTRTIWTQNVPDSVFNYTYEMMAASRDSIRILLEANNKLLWIDTANQRTIKYLTNQINDQDSEIIFFKNKEAKVVIPPLISWDGFYLNFIPAYIFDPAYVSGRIVKTLKYALSCEFIFKVLDKIKLSIEPVLPIGDKFRIQGKIGYRLF